MHGESSLITIITSILNFPRKYCCYILHSFQYFLLYIYTLYNMFSTNEYHIYQRANILQSLVIILPQNKQIHIYVHLRILYPGEKHIL